MAERKPMFMSSEGFSEEMAQADTATFGGLTLGGNIAMGTHLITGLGDPVAAQDAATKAYVDAVAQSIVIKDPVHALSSVNVVSLSGPTTIDGTPVVAGERVLLTGQTAVPFSGTGDSLTFATGTVTLVDAGGAFTAASVGKKITITGATNPGNNGTFTIATYVDPTSITFANASGVTETSAFVYTGQIGINNGIWVVQTGAWTRPLDFAAASHGAGAFVFVERGTLYADTGWVCTSDSPNDVVGTDYLTWVQFSSAGQIDAGAGLTKTGNVLAVGDGAGILVNADNVEVDLATDPGLEFDAVGVLGKLRAKVLAAGGIQRLSTGLSILIDDTPDTLDVDADGLKVVGLPSLFKVNGTAVSVNVTATNLTTLTGGGNADALHNHSTGAATEAPKLENTIAVSEAIAAGDPVYWSATNDRVGKGDAANNAKSYIIGIARTAQSTPGDTSEVVTRGPCTSVLSGATAGTPYYLQSGGGIGTSVPGAGRRVIMVGFAMNATDLFVDIRDYGKKAA